MDTIKSSKEISFLLDKGKRLHTPFATLVIMRSENKHDPRGRVVFIAGKRNGNAVWRNKAKRRMRSVCRDCGGPFPGWDVAFIAKKNINQVRYSELLDKVNFQLANSHITNDGRKDNERDGQAAS